MALPLNKHTRLGEILIRRQALKPEALEQGLSAQATKLLPIGSTLINLGLVSEEDVALALAEQFGVPGVDLGSSIISTSVLGVIPQEVAAAHLVLPLSFQAQSVQVAIANPAQQSLLDEVAFACGRAALPFVAARSVLEEVIKQAHAARQKGLALWKGPRAQGDEPRVVTLQPRPPNALAEGAVAFEQELPDVAIEGTFGVSTGSGPAARGEGAPPRVLAVDDEPEILELIDKALSRRGVEVIKASRGREALEALRRSGPDLVLLDAMLPEIHGFEICMKIKQSQQYRHVPVMIISAIYTGWNFVQDVKRIYGADDYMSKPFRVVELVRRVEELLSRSKGRPRSPEVQHALKQAAKECTLAAEQYKNGQVQESIDSAQRAVEADPFDSRAHFLLGTALHRMGRIYEAISEYGRVVELAPTLFSALKNLAVLYERQGFKAKAVEMWMRAVAQSPSEAVRQTIKAHLIGLL